MNKNIDRCEICDKTIISYSNIHHIDGNHNNNRNKNIIFICQLCHKKIHEPTMINKKPHRTKDTSKKQMKLLEKYSNLYYQGILKRKKIHHS